MGNNGRCIQRYFRTGARSGMKRSPRTSTSLEAIVTSYFYHWLLEDGGLASVEEVAYCDFMPVLESKRLWIVLLRKLLHKMFA